MRLPNPFLTQQVQREAKFLIECLFLLEPQRPALREAIDAGVRWNRVARLAISSGVAGPVYRSLLDAGLLDNIAPAAREELERVYLGTTAQNSLSLREIASVCRALDEEGIASIALKGTALLLTRYPCRGSRIASDIDLLVQPDRIEDAARVLEARGYHTKPDPEGNVKEPERGHHLPPFIHPRGIAIELHRWIVGPGERADAEWAALFARSREVPVHGRRVRIPSEADLLAIACTHVMECHEGALIFLPRHVADLHVLLARDPVDVRLALTLFPGHEPAILESLGLLVDCGRGHGLPRARPRYSASELFAPSIGWHDVREVAMRAINIGRHPYGAFRGIFPSSRWMHELYGPGWLPRLYARRFAEKLVPDSLRKW